MRRTRIAVLHIILCSLLAAACHLIGPKSSTTYPPPPSTSYRVESVSFDGGPQEIRAAFVKPDFIKTVRVQPMLGRNFLEEEYLTESSAVALLSDGLWRQRYGADPQIVGGIVKLNGRKYTVIGVLPEAFKHPPQAEIWLPDDMK